VVSHLAPVGFVNGFIKCWELPFLAIEQLLAAGADFHVAAMSDPRLMPPAERGLRRAGYTGWVEEEFCDAYKAAAGGRLGAVLTLRASSRPTG
jgi:hypothetical protein